MWRLSLLEVTACQMASDLVMLIIGCIERQALGKARSLGIGLILDWHSGFWVWSLGSVLDHAAFCFLYRYPMTATVTFSSE